MFRSTFEYDSALGHSRLLPPSMSKSTSLFRKKFPMTVPLGIFYQIDACKYVQLLEEDFRFLCDVLGLSHLWS